MKIKKGDKVLIITGKDKGKTGKVIKALPKKNQVIVEGVNLKKKHIRPRREGEKGQIVTISFPIDVSNVKLLCPHCGKATRVGYRLEERKKLRVCKKCQQTI